MGSKILAVNLDLCTGCRSCELRCAFKHHHECNPIKSRITVVKFDRMGLSVPIFCLNCRDAFCQSACPVKAIKRDVNTGALILQEKKCIGCLVCTIACPFSGFQVLPNKKVVKCDLCGGDPYCVKYCDTGALQYVDMEDLRARKIYTLAEEFILPYKTKEY